MAYLNSKDIDNILKKQTIKKQTMTTDLNTNPYSNMSKEEVRKLQLGAAKWKAPKTVGLGEAIAKGSVETVKDIGAFGTNLVLDVVKAPFTIDRMTDNFAMKTDKKATGFEKFLADTQRSIGREYRTEQNMDVNQGGIMDAINYLGRPVQAVMGAIKPAQGLAEDKNLGDVSKGAIQGLLGEKTTSGGSILRNTKLDVFKESKGVGTDDVAGFIFENLVDPTNWVGLGEVKNLAKRTILKKQAQDIIEKSALTSSKEGAELMANQVVDNLSNKIDNANLKPIQDTLPQTNGITPNKIETSPQVAKTVPKKAKPIKTIEEANDIVESGVKQRGFVQTVIADKKTPKQVVEKLKQDENVYLIQTDINTLNKVNDNIEKLGFDNSLTGVKNKFTTGQRFTKEDTVTMERLYQEAMNKGDFTTASDIISDLAVLGTEQGQSIQALGMIKKLTPEGRLMQVEKLLNRENAKLLPKQQQKMLKKLGKQNIDLPQELKNNILSAKNTDELDKAVNEALLEINNQLPLDFGDKLRSWRYLSMLGNPRTHIRNLLGNTAMKTTAKVKNKISGAMEDLISRFTKIERTKTLGRASKEQRLFAKQDALSIKDRIVGNNKYDLNTQKRAFDNKFMNKVAQGSSGLLEKEDWLFSGKAYQDAFANYMKANKLSPEFLKSGTKEANLMLEKGRQVAIKEAQEQTFRQENQLANALSQFENKNAITKTTIGAILPFKKTPFNIAKTGYEYSPARFIQSLNDFKKIVKATPTDKPELITKAIDGLAKGLTGSGIMLMGYGLASTGIISASAPDNIKASMLDQSQGKQPYSVNILGKSYTLDWLSPTAMPLFAGVEMYNLANDKSVDDPNKVVTRAMAMFEGASKLMDPLTQMSMLQGVNSTLQSYNNNAPGGYLGAVGINLAQNYAGQFIPTVAGQLARTIDTKRRDTTAKGSGIDKIAGTFINKQKAKIPFISKTLEPYTNQFGKEEKTGDLPTRIFSNFVSPGYLKTIKTTAIDKEIERLYKMTGEQSVLPTSSSRYFTVNGKKIYLTPKEYTDFNKQDGKEVLSRINRLISSSDYKDMSDEEKVNKIKSIYNYSQKIAKYNYFKNK
jgi:hypothetical protein